VSFDKFLQESAVLINKEIEFFFPRKIKSAWLYSSLGKDKYEFDEKAVQESLANPIWDFLDRGGKRWRPALTLLACEAVGGKKKDALLVSVIPEFVHNGTIMVDDVEDNSALRRGKPSTHLLFGIDVAVNAANAMYYLPLIVLFNSDKIPHQKKADIYDLYSKEMLRLSVGQAMDINWHNNQRTVSEKQYLQMCSYKTGSLARLSAQLGGIMGNGSEAQISALGDFGTSIGVSFQIQDDILNIQPEKKWGKEIGDDIKEGKITLIVIRALGKISAEKKKRLLSILGSKSKSDSDVTEAIKILDESGAIEYTKNTAQEIVRDSWKALDKVLPKSHSKDLLKEFADYVIERKF